MITVRKASDRGHFNLGWLDTYHTFSFGDYHDERFKGFSKLRVINEDFIEAGKGFPTHAHWDMEIITYVLAGALAHKDSLGNGSTIVPGDVQYMSAGTGVEHSEYNALKDKATHILQIWILTKEKGQTPLYGQKNFPDHSKKGKLCLVASEMGEAESVKIRQDVQMYASILEKNQQLTYDLKKGRSAWIQVVRGALNVNETLLEKGDGASVTSESVLKITGTSDFNEFLLFNLP